MIVDDVGGVAGGNILTVIRSGSDTVNAGTQVSIIAPYGYLALASDGTSRWTIVDAPGLQPNMNLADLTNPSAARLNLNVPSLGQALALAVAF